MWKDPIVEEVRRIRDEHAKKFNYDIDAIFRDIKRREKRSGRKYVTPGAQTHQETSCMTLTTPRNRPHERDEAIRRVPYALYPWDGFAGVQLFGVMEKAIVEGVY